MGADGQVRRIGLRRRQARHLLVVLHEIVHGGHMDLGVAEGPGQAGVHLEDHQAGVVHDVLLVGDAQGEGHEAVLVGRRAGAKEDIGPVRVDAVRGGAVEHVGHVGDGARARLEGGAGARRMEPRGQLEVPLHLLLHVEVVLLEGEHGEDPHVLHPVGHDVEAGHAALGLRSALGHDHIVIAGDVGDGLVDGDELAAVGFLVVHDGSCGLMDSDRPRARWPPMASTRDRALRGDSSKADSSPE